MTEEQRAEWACIPKKAGNARRREIATAILEQSCDYNPHARRHEICAQVCPLTSVPDYAVACPLV
jgi:NADPH-dependent 7-cyano-7-deazaguanine reductase QueF